MIHEIYRSLNGDRWLLITDAADRLVVRHEPALASGGRTTETPVDEWLNRTGISPENQALRELLERLGLNAHDQDLTARRS